MLLLHRYPSSNLDLQCSFRNSFSSISGQSFIGIVGGKVIAADENVVVTTTSKGNHLTTIFGYGKKQEGMATE